MFVAFPSTALMELAVSLQLSEAPAKLLSSNIDEVVPVAIETSITSPSQIASQPPQSVPEPSSILLLGAAISLLRLSGVANDSRLC